MPEIMIESIIEDCIVLVYEKLNPVTLIDGSTFTQYAALPVGSPGEGVDGVLNVTV